MAVKVKEGDATIYHVLQLRSVPLARTKFTLTHFIYTNKNIALIAACNSF